VDARAGLDDLEKKILDPTGTRNTDPTVVEPVASRYTDYATPAPRMSNDANKIIYTKFSA
jgi:hypothetical protein